MHSCAGKSWNVVVDDGSFLRKLEVCHFLYYFGLCTSLSLKNAGDGTFAGRIFLAKNTWWVHQVQHRIAKGYLNSTCNKHRVICKTTTDPGLCSLEFARWPVCVNADESHNNQMSAKIILIDHHGFCPILQFGECFHHNFQAKQQVSGEILSEAKLPQVNGWFGGCWQEYSGSWKLKVPFFPSSLLFTKVTITARINVCYMLGTSIATTNKKC